MMLVAHGLKVMKVTDSVIKLTKTNGNKISVTYVKVMKDPTDNGASLALRVC